MTDVASQMVSATGDDLCLKFKIVWLVGSVDTVQYSTCPYSTDNGVKWNNYKLSVSVCSGRSDQGSYRNIGNRLNRLKKIRLGTVYLKNEKESFNNFVEIFVGTVGYMDRHVMHDASLH